MKKINIKIPKLIINGIDVIKNAFFFILFLIITLIFTITIIAPAVKKFKQTKKEYYQTKEEYKHTLNTYNKNLSELKLLKKKNYKILSNLNRDFNKKNFIYFSSKFFQIKTIKKINTTINTSYKIETYKIKATINSPEEFFKFIKALEKYKYLIEITYPIKFYKKENLFIEFNIKGYQLKEKYEI